MKKTAKRLLGAALSALLCVPVAMGALSACKEQKDPKGGEDVKQTDVKDSAAVAFTQLGEVKINDAYAANGMEKEVDYLLKLDADKLLYYFYVNAGLKPVASSSYGGGWEGALIGGHTLGHYLTALAQAYANANTSDRDKKEILNVIQYVTASLRECQNNAEAAGANKGFLWGARKLPGNPEIQFNNVEANKTDITSQAWVPWYTMHKIVAGLLDCATLAGDETAKEVAVALGDWVCERVGKWDSKIQLTVLNIEYGGMNDCMYNLYALTGEEKYAVAAHMFDEEALFDRVIAAPANYLNGKHANTTIPKILGALNRYVTCHGKTIGGKSVDADYYLEVAETFWQYVIDHHTYVTGGNSEWEHFGADDVLNKERTNCTCETCNTYNMLKLSRTLFTVTKDKKYLDYYENTYYNAILSSQNPETGMTTYFQPMATGYYKVYSSEEHHFWCCTGSGMESFSKLGDSIYYTAGNATYVSLYLSSEYRTESVSLAMTADLENSDGAEISVTEGETVLRLRRPYWTGAFGVTVNDGAVEVKDSDDFVSVAVKKGDRVRVEFKKEIKAYNLPDGENVYAFLYGPFVLSAELGEENVDYTAPKTVGVSVSIPDNVDGTSSESGHDRNSGANYTVGVKEGSLADFIGSINEKLVRGENGKFTLTGTEPALTYSVHYRQHTQRYGIYMTFTASEAPAEEEAAWSWDAQDTVQPGYGQYETDALHNMQATDSVGATNVENLGTTRKANAGGSFTYRMKVDQNAENRLAVTFAKADNNKTILIKSGATTLYSKTLNYTGAQTSYSVEIAIPASVVAAAERIEYTDEGGTKQSAVVIPVTFSGVGGAESARVCTYIYSQKRVFNEKAQDSKIAYFVDCGDYDVYTLSGSDKLGTCQSVTEQAYGADKVTGKKWGIVDTYASTGAGAAPGGVYTNSTWAYEQGGIADGAEKTFSNRYTKNQTESGLDRKLGYRFDLDNGTYTVKMYFTDPWGVSKNPCVSANGAQKIKNGAVDKELTFTVTVTEGELSLDITSSELCINLAYIIIMPA